MKQFQTYGPLRLMTAMFTRQFIEPALKTAEKAESITAQRQHFLAENCVVRPVRQPNLDSDHLAVIRVLLDDFQESMMPKPSRWRIPLVRMSVVMRVPESLSKAF